MLSIDDIKNTIINDDCLKIMKQLPDKCIDLCLTDPPYGIDFQSNMRTKSFKFDKLENDDNDFRFSVYPEIYRALKDNCVAVIFCSFKNYADDYKELEKLFDIKNCIVWDKGGGGIGDLVHSLLTDYELAIVAHKGQCEIRGKREGSVWNCGKVNPNTQEHPTEKPAQLMAKFIRQFTDRDGLILDPFLGSGTTAVAAKMEGRKCIGIEISPKYCEIARQRVSSAPSPLFT